MMGKGFKYTAYGVLAAAVIGGLAYLMKPKPVLVDLGTVARGPVVVSVVAEGKTQVREVYQVSAPITGRLLRVRVHAGDQVEAGKTELAVLQPPAPAFLDSRARAQAQAQVAAAEAAQKLAQADLRRVQSELNFARNELDRARQLAERQSIPQKELERAELNVETQMAAEAQARARLAVAWSELEMARAALIDPESADPGKSQDSADCCVTVTAPVSGQVLRVYRESEGVIQTGTPLLDLGDPSDLEVVADLLSTDALRIGEGAQVVIEDWGGGPPLPATVHRIEPYGFTKVSALGIEEQRVNVVILFTGDKAARGRLGHGFQVSARIVVAKKDDAPTLPIAALFRHDGGWATFAVEDGVAVLKPITLGLVNDELAEIAGGLDEGARVVLHPGSRVEAGMEVEER